MGCNEARRGWWQAFVAESPARTGKLAIVGTANARQYGERNAVPPEMVVRVTPTNVVAKVDVAG